MHSNVQAKIRPVVLSGGSGTRLWPFSRDNYPKQFIRLINNESLFLATLKRISDRRRYAAPMIIGNIEHMPFILVELALLGITDAIVILEPCGRNTASAAIVAALHEKEAGMLHLVLPCDHHMKDEGRFHASVLEGAAVAGEHIVLFGITPGYPETGYGYIVPGEIIGNSSVRRIGVFTEKPNTTFASVLIQQQALWNSGVFLYDPVFLREESGRLAALHYEQCRAALTNAICKDNCVMLRLEDYMPLENRAFDTLIMEATERGAVLPCDMGWSDVGSWHSLWQMAGKDENGNAIQGAVVTKDVHNSYLRSDGIPVVALGIEDCAVVARKDGVLVARRAHAQAVKEMVSSVGRESEAQMDATNDFGVPPWGIYKGIAQGKNYRVKEIVVRPGGATSLQEHQHRAEYWVVIAGIARAECGDDVKTLSPGESAFIPQGARHRLGNAGDEDLRVVEIQSGDYLGEDDIVRFEDLYGRV